MTKRTDRNKSLLGLTVPEGETMTIMTWDMAAGRQAGMHGAGTVAKSSYCIHKYEAEAKWVRCRLLKAQSPSVETHLLQQGHSFQTVSLTGDQTFKHVNLGGPFLFKPLHSHCF